MARRRVQLVVSRRNVDLAAPPTVPAPALNASMRSNNSPCSMMEPRVTLFINGGKKGTNLPFSDEMGVKGNEPNWNEHPTLTSYGKTGVTYFCQR